MKTIDIYGDNFTGAVGGVRQAGRAAVLRDGRLLLSYAKETDIYMLPGGGLEAGETDAECCVREAAEETGLVIEVQSCALEINEYYGDLRFTSRYFAGTVTGQCEMKLTEEEKEIGLTPVWLPLSEAAEIFSEHRSLTAEDEEKRGIYLRELTALLELFPGMIQEGEKA